MGLFKKLTRRVFSGKPQSQNTDKELLRRCYFEVMEQRRVLSADPVVAAITYLEGDVGQDVAPDHFEVTFEGGSETTQLTRFTISGDQDNSGGLSDGDMFFDIAQTQPGAGGFHPFLFDAENSSGISASDIKSFQVSADGLMLTVEVTNFEAGDLLAFTIDVDEVERYRTDMIASGVEFEGSFFKADFVDQHYDLAQLDVSITANLDDGFQQIQDSGIFYDDYDQLLAAGEEESGSLLTVTRDSQHDQPNRTAGTIDAYELTPKPISIGGTIYHDENVNCLHDADESGIAGVDVTLEKLNRSTGEYEQVATTRTDAVGNYEFGLDLNLQPGTYRLVETQPEGFLDVGAEAGSEGGVVVESADGGKNIISDIQIPLGGTAATDYDFKEVLPATLSGHVWHDQNDDGVFNSNESGIANVLIQVTRVSGKPGTAQDLFAATDPVFVRTDANGYYQVEQLPPGIYEIVEVNQYPGGEVDPLAGYIDGKDSLGTVGNTTIGSQTNDKFSQIELCAGDEGANFNFGELKPVQISGNVTVVTPDGECLDPSDPNHVGIAGVEIELFDVDGNLVASTLTDNDGHYVFSDLAPGTYTVVEIQPAGYLDGEQHVGQINGQTAGVADQNDQFSNITLTSGQEASRYDFCEHVPAELCGTVYHDRNNNGIQDSGEEGIAGVRLMLTDADGNLLAEQFTDAQGNYCFENLYPGEYCVKEIQPAGYLDGIDTAGSVNGLVQGHVVDDAICQVTLGSGSTGSNFNFGELLPGQISGTVHVDANGDCVYDPADGERVLAGVTLELLDSNGQVIATTLTDANGNYQFGNLAPGQYAIRQVQPDGLFSGGESAGTGGGLASSNLIEGIVVGSAQQLTHYDFCEVDAAEIHGRVWEDGPAIETEDGQPFSGYRTLRDGIYQEGIDTPLAGVHMQLYFYIDPINGSTVPRAVTLGEVLGEHYTHLGTTNPDAPIWVETMANGEYWFAGLPAGNYIVLESQPGGFYDGNDEPGTTSGFSYNSIESVATAPQSVISTFSSEQIMDSVVNIRVNAGEVSQMNNFSEIQFTANPDTPPGTPPNTPPQPSDPESPRPPGVGLTSLPGLYGAQPSAFTQFVGTARGATGASQSSVDAYTWHLSVINGGQPRNVGEAMEAGSVWVQAGFISNDDWTRFDMNEAVWTFGENSADGKEIQLSDRNVRFGMLTGIPLAGDFDGDGTDEVAVFKDGYWLIDINRNGIWDEADLMAKLGNEGDRPVVGDWDGDGKDDIGIFGPIWEHDPAAIASEPGLPNPDNAPFTRPKNVPPVAEDASHGSRVMKLTSYGRQRADVVDHVFGIGHETEVPVTGDWNGNGIRSIGTFEAGHWKLDVNGDGHFNQDDVTAEFGAAGDIPLVGDFDGNGIEEIAIYRSGTWIIDSNGNRELDATDRTFQLGGGAHDQPVVGDFNGDGLDDPGLYTDQANARID